MKYMRLKEVCSIKMGQSPSSDSYNDNGEGIPFFQGNADFGERYPVARKWCSAPMKIAEPENILISVRAPIGALNYAKEKCCIGRGLAALTPNKSIILPEFMFWLLKEKNAELNSKGTGSTFKAIGRKVLEEILVPDIGIEQQAEYSAILEKINGIIQFRKQELQKLDDLIRARFIEMFGDPIHNPKGWDTSLVEDVVANEKNALKAGPFGSTLKKEYYVESGYKIYGQEQVISGDHTIGNYYIDEERYRALENCAVQAGDVLISLVGTYGKLLIIPDEFEPGIINPRLMKITFDKNKVNPLYFKFFFQSESLKRALSANTHGGTMDILNLGIVRKISMPIPPLKLQNKFVSFVEQVDKSKVAVQKALDETQLLFDSLMQKYFG